MFRKLRVFLCAVVVFALFGVLAATAQQVSGISVPEGLEPLGEEFEPIDIVQEENSASVIRKGPAPAITYYGYAGTYKATDTGEVVVATYTKGYGSKVVRVDGVVAKLFKTKAKLDSANVAYGFFDYYRTGRMPSDFNTKSQSDGTKMLFIQASAVSVDGSTPSWSQEVVFPPNDLKPVP